MFRGFNLVNLSFANPAHITGYGKLLAETDQEEVRTTLEEFVEAGGSLDGGRLQSTWFPEINADVFISHSSSDEPLASALAGWLRMHFGLRAFIDSSVWGSAYHLLKIVDNRYCLKEEAGPTYDYSKRNQSTSHVYMMLTTALSMMIDRCECLFFLNTPASITPGEAVAETYSPWLYAEITMARMIEKKRPKRWTELTVLAEKSAAEQRRIMTHPVDLSHLADIGSDKLIRWESEYNPRHGHALDVLYEILADEE